jgi:thiol-disulfide isomerase/thioredoxin
MARCPKCKAEIDHLINWSKCWVEYIFKVDKDGNYGYEATGDQESDIDNVYSCPECGETLTYDEDEAVRILTGQQEVSWVDNQQVESI